MSVQIAEQEHEKPECHTPPKRCEDPSITQHKHAVPNPPKDPIQCLHSAKYTGDMGGNPDLLFTHSAGGDLHTPSSANFVNGFVNTASRKTVFAFKGNVNLKSRVSMFKTILDQNLVQTEETSIRIEPTCLGGRSMGARAAVEAAREGTTHLVLVSYPLHTDKSVRDQILLNIPEHVKVIFVTGDRDEMCDLARLDEVREKMQCQTWRVVVHSADHAMACKPMSTAEAIQRETGRVVSGWLDDADPDKTEGRIFWDGEEGMARWTGWSDDSRHGQLVDDPFSPGGKAAKKRKRGQKKSHAEPAEGTQPAKKRKAEDQDPSKEGERSTKKKTSKRHQKARQFFRRKGYSN